MEIAEKVTTPFSLQMRGTFLVALSGMLYGLIGYFGTQLFRDNFSVSGMLFWRFFIAALWLLIISFVAKKNIFQSTGNHRELFKTVLLGVVCYSAASACYFLASKRTGTGLAMVIFFSFPVFVMLFSWLSPHWKMNKYALIALVMILMGLILLKGHGSHTLGILGIFFAIISAFLYAIYVYGSRNSSKIDSRLLSLLICLGNAIIFLIISYANQSFAFPNSLHEWFDICTLGIVATALPIQLMLDGMKYISPVKASMLSVLEPLVTVIAGLMLLHETVSHIQLLGVLVVLLGVIMIQFE